MPNFTARAGMTLRASTGLEALGEPNRMSTIFFYRAHPGDRLTLLDRMYLYNVATYAPEVEDKYIYTYSYQPNQSWTRYNGDLSGDSYRTGDYVFTSDCYFRLCFKRADGANFTDADADAVNDIIRFDGAEPEPHTPPEFIKQEAARVLPQIERQAGSLVFALLTDTHVTVNGTWDDTLASLREVNNAAKFDGVIHLGDLTDGMVTAKATRQYVRDIKEGLLSLGCPLYIAIGNHDSNYFGKNTEPFTIEEQRELYLSHLGVDKPWYYVDYPGLRMLFLHSFDNTEKYRYGYCDECLDWVENTLAKTPDGVSVLVFSHLTLLTRLQIWTDHIRGGERLVEILQDFNSHGRLLGYINGHNHADQTDTELRFPVVSVGCAKTEYFLEHKPQGSATPERRIGDASQVLWDALVVTPERDRFELVRFGAGIIEGEDRNGF